MCLSLRFGIGGENYMVEAVGIFFILGAYVTVAVCVGLVLRRIVPQNLQTLILQKLGLDDEKFHPYDRD
jgi:hypothetical protein